MKKILLSIFIFLIYNSIYSQVVVLSEDFSGIVNNQTGNSFMLPGWNQTRDTDVFYTDGWSVDNGGAWLRDGFNNNGTTGAIRINMTNNVKRDFLISPMVDLSMVPATGSYTVSWDMAFTNNNNSATTFQALNPGDEIHLVVSLDGGATFTSLMFFDSASTIINGGETFSVDLDSSYFSSTVVFAFWAYEGNVTTLATNVFVDNFEVAESAPLSIDELSSIEEVSIYPTLTTDNLQVENCELHEVILFTVTGKQISVEFNDSTIYTNYLESGIYFAQLIDVNGNVFTRKFIKS
ncbi:T9SS type A sorting domain-containing protein [Nonlabens ulvanivorans]|uniref:T9SS type A sorting domain-containing protein n=1 Tax=Nonlabens ulvanivorans TaxID=906888 RepID=UPI0029427C62|nr:T9SS type A sorting domain-containing protein [Nonlabens ulvanivorans]WOI22415.1 T9SS type A sorting domain-containing protein [Nonlabens ulvanivorans]